ncbi:Nif11-like leader peptide family natural product precursor [Bradyrhizobium yuanmingense]|uniref:Nif11-like leader peptide family natural product precursor n=1 Tax=Bradyrhizobium yuanmingense TaxID=108015 RepID=UPI000C1FBDCD|nr:Nif11-like leader peptide family natural product precursor [Bradyrhizobium yuanmingense]
MSQAEVERFVKNLAKEGSLLEDLKQSATGLAPIVAVGKSHGYDFTLDEVRSSIRVPGRDELMQLDAIVGGKQDLSGAGLSRLCIPLRWRVPRRRHPRAPCKPRKRAVTWSLSFCLL